jgi:DnaJ-class molecular chaperone
MQHEDECPKCFGAKEVMEPRETKGFEYRTCTLCGGSGIVSTQVAQDFIFSLNEENFDEDE